MNENEQKYLSVLKQRVYDQISAEINEFVIGDIVDLNLVKSHLDDKLAAKFHRYYFFTIGNEKHYLGSTCFFREFKKSYSLQGIDNNYLDRLEGLKSEILKNIHSGNLVGVYYGNFKNALIKHGFAVKEKELGSFFAKLVHTFRPEEYCALDNPIKNYFGLKKESFFISFITISFAYKRWAIDNKILVDIIREKFNQADKQGLLQHDKITDLKLLDLIFWSKANRK